MHGPYWGKFSWVLVYPVPVYCIGCCNIENGVYRYMDDLTLFDSHRSSGGDVTRWCRTIPVSTPIIYGEWSRQLQSHPDERFVGYILDGLREGFRIGMDRSLAPKPEKRNHPSARAHPSVVDDYLSAERREGRFSPPVPKRWWNQCQISPIGVIPKSQPGKWRLITDLSSPRAGSINDGIPSEAASLHYDGIDDAVQIMLSLGQGAFMSKVDLKSAYRILPIHAEDRPLLGIKWNGEVLLDMPLPFGLWSAPKIFSAFADALAWVTRQHGVLHQIHYLDDFSIAGPPNSTECMRDFQTFARCCESLGVPIAQEKLVSPSSVLTFLGIELDSQQRQLRLPADKLSRLQRSLITWSGRRSCRKRELQSLLGYLNHAATVVKPGRSFVRRMIELLPVAKHPDHFIRLNVSFRADLLWWQLFSQSWNGVSVIPARAAIDSMQVVSDASGSWGCGAIWGQNWCQLQWPQEWLSIPITAKELAPIVVASMLWGLGWYGQRVQFVCDNMAVVACVNSGSSKDSLVVHLLRALWFVSAKFCFEVHAVHIPGQLNQAADALSRGNQSSFFSVFPQAKPVKTQIPSTWVDMLLVRKCD